MKKPFIVLILLISYNSFFAQEKQKQLYRKPLTFSIGLSTTQFYEGDSDAIVESEQGNATLYYSKSEGFDKPLYGLFLSVEKEFSLRYTMGVETGYARIIDSRNQAEMAYYHIFPTHLTFSYSIFKQHKFFISPLLKIKAGYTYMNNDPYNGRPFNVITGGYSYGAMIDISFKKKSYKWIEKFHFSIGYHAFFTKNHSKTTLSSNTYEFYYNTKREGLTFGVNYNFTQKKKRKKHKKKH